MTLTHPESVVTLLVVGGLATLALRHLMVWEREPGRSHLPWVLISVSGIAFGVLRVLYLATDDPAWAVMLSRGQYVVTLFLPALALASLETLAEQPRSRTTTMMLLASLPLAVAVQLTPWFVHGPVVVRVDALGHRFWAGQTGLGTAALVPLIAWSIAAIYRRVTLLPPVLREARSWLRVVVVAFLPLAANDMLLSAGLVRSVHLLELGYLLFAIGATRFEVHRTMALRAALATELEERRRVLVAKEASLDQARAELESTHARLVRADRLAALGTLAAGTAHEINNPLTFVVGNAELLTEELQRLAPQLPPGSFDDARVLVTDLEAGAARIRRVVEQLLVLARDRGTGEGPVDVRAILELALAMAAHHLKHRAQIVRDLPPLPPVRGSEAQLGQVFLNLLVNAAQAIPEGHLAEHVVRVTARAVDDKVVIEVSDTGVGMTPEVRARVFDPFFTTKDVGHGTGLGLAISLGIVTQLGGAIDCTSEPGHGTTFRVELPALTEAVASAAPLASEPPASRARTVLVVDDEELVARTVARMLAPDQVEVVLSGRAALALGSLARFDAIVCDVMMPDVTGMELYQRVLAREPEAARRFVFLTGGVFTPEAERFLEGRRWLTKPVSRRELAEAIAAVVPAA